MNPRFWKQAAEAPHRLLMLDYDGTLAPFREARSEAVPVEGALDLLRAIASSKRTTVAIISGRPLDELEPLVSPLPVWLVGGHGWEERSPEGRRRRHPIPGDLEAALDRAEAAARLRGLGDHLERKRASIMMHTRGLPDDRAPEMERECLEAWRSSQLPPGLKILTADGGCELGVAARNKGSAVREMMGRAPKGTFPVYLGDDRTDEDAFNELTEHGLGIRVGPVERPSLARARIASIDGVPAFLETWLARVENAPVAEEARS